MRKTEIDNQDINEPDSWDIPLDPSYALPRLHAAEKLKNAILKAQEQNATPQKQKVRKFKLGRLEIKYRC